ncbi:hypothetical protein [Rothia sp. CCM 9416]|uniref:hypothetical protein n=1 Tax=Rothia sp. CCM 9416 TaxID=3402655 RepID=UPI003AE1154C
MEFENKNNGLNFGPESIDLVNSQFLLDQITSIQINFPHDENKETGDSVNKISTGFEKSEQRAPLSGKGDSISNFFSGIFKTASNFIPILSLVVAFFGIVIPLHANNTLLERTQADKIFHYIVKGNESCGPGDDMNPESSEAANRWKICIKNPSEAPIYEVKTRGNRSDNYKIMHNQTEYGMQYGIAGTSTVWQIMPGESKSVWELDQGLLVDGQSIPGKTYEIDVEYQFKDNKGIIWNGKYSFKNLDDEDNGAKFIRDSPLNKGESMVFLDKGASPANTVK